MPNAHPVIITEDEAKAIAELRTGRCRKHSPIRGQKQLISPWVHEMTLDTKKLNIEVKYKVPEEMYMICGLAGRVS